MLVKRLGALGVATVHEAYGPHRPDEALYAPDLGRRVEVAGTAVTVLAQPGDNWMIHVAVEQCQPGDMLVVGCTADNTDGMFGDLLATSLKARGVKAWSSMPAAATSKTLKEMGFPVWSQAISAKGTVKATLGAVNIPVVCAGVNRRCPATSWSPTTTASWWSAGKDAAEVADKGEKREADEEGKREKLASGMLGLDMYNMREPLEKAGLVYVDNPED